MGLDFYAILNVPKNCQTNKIKLAYRKWAICTHPNRQPYPTHPKNPPEGIHLEVSHLPSLPKYKVWKYVNEAYDVLVNPLTREIYDKYGEEGLKTGTPTPNGYVAPYVYHENFLKTFQDAMGTMSPYADLVDAVTRPPPLYTVQEGKGLIMKDQIIEKTLYLDLKDVFYGGIKKVQIFRHEYVDETKTITEIREKILIVPIHRGIAAGCRIEFKEAGDRGPTKIPADIVYNILDKIDPVYVREGSDLFMTYKITMQQAMCGFVIELNTIDDRRILIAVTDAVNPASIKTVENEGLPLENDPSKKGNLYIKFDIAFPNVLSKECKEKLAELFSKSPCLLANNMVE